MAGRISRISRISPIGLRSPIGQIGPISQISPIPSAFPQLPLASIRLGLGCLSDGAYKIGQKGK